MNKDFIMKNKEIIIAITFVIIIVIFFFVNYYIELNKERTIFDKEKITQLEKVAEEKSYILKNGKLYITYNGK